MVALLVCKSPGTATMLTLCFRIADDPSVFESGVLTALRRSLCGVTKKKSLQPLTRYLVRWPSCSRTRVSYLVPGMKVVLRCSRDVDRLRKSEIGRSAEWKHPSFKMSLFFGCFRKRVTGIASIGTVLESETSHVLYYMWGCRDVLVPVAQQSVPNTEAPCRYLFDDRNAESQCHLLEQVCSTSYSRNKAILHSTPGTRAPTTFPKSRPAC